jgi:hypothetical protein
VTSVIGTKELQKAEALRATKMALQSPTLSRATISERPMLAAEANGDSRPRAATIEVEEMYMTNHWVSICYVKLQRMGSIVSMRLYILAVSQ